jgi:hypothetical protein
MNACSERNPLSLAADRICRRNLSVGNARLRSILCFRLFDPPHFCLWRICGATTEKAPQRNCLVALDLAPETRDATPPFFMFQYPAYPAVNPLPRAKFHCSSPLLFRSRPECTHLHRSIPNCSTLHLFAPFSPHNEFDLPAPLHQYRRTTSTHAALLQSFLQFSSLVVANCRNLSPSVPDCLNLSPSVPNCPLLSHQHFSSEAQRCIRFFLTFSCLEVP